MPVAIIRMVMAELTEKGIYATADEAALEAPAFEPMITVYVFWKMAVEG